MAASLAIFGGLVISCATSTSLRFWVQVTCIFSNFIDSKVFFDRVGWNIQHFCILMQTSISMAFKFNKKKREYFKENLPQNFLVT